MNYSCGITSIIHFIPQSFPDRQFASAVCEFPSVWQTCQISQMFTCLSARLGKATFSQFKWWAFQVLTASRSTQHFTPSISLTGFSSVQTRVCGGKVGQIIRLASKEVQRLAGPVTVNQSKQRQHLSYGIINTQTTRTAEREHNTLIYTCTGHSGTRITRYQIQLWTFINAKHVITC